MNKAIDVDQSSSGFNFPVCLKLTQTKGTMQGI